MSHFFWAQSLQRQVWYGNVFPFKITLRWIAGRSPIVRYHIPKYNPGVASNWHTYQLWSRPFSGGEILPHVRQTIISTEKTSQNILVKSRLKLCQTHIKSLCWLDLVRLPLKNCTLLQFFLSPKSQHFAGWTSSPSRTSALSLVFIHAFYWLNMFKHG